MEENNNEKVRKGSLEASESQEEIVQQEINEQESIQEEMRLIHICVKLKVLVKNLKLAIKL